MNFPCLGFSTIIEAFMLYVTVFVNSLPILFNTFLYCHDKKINYSPYHDGIDISVTIGDRPRFFLI